MPGEIPHISRENEYYVQDALADAIHESKIKLETLSDDFWKGREAITVLPRDGAEKMGWKSDYPLRLREGAGKTKEINAIAEGAQITITGSPENKPDKDGDHWWYPVEIPTGNLRDPRGAKKGYVSAEFIESELPEEKASTPDVPKAIGIVTPSAPVPKKEPVLQSGIPPEDARQPEQGSSGMPPMDNPKIEGKSGQSGTPALDTSNRGKSGNFSNAPEDSRTKSGSPGLPPDDSDSAASSLKKPPEPLPLPVSPSDRPDKPVTPTAPSGGPNIPTLPDSGSGTPKTPNIPTGNSGNAGPLSVPGVSSGTALPLDLPGNNSGKTKPLGIPDKGSGLPKAFDVPGVSSGTALPLNPPENGSGGSQPLESPVNGSDKPEGLPHPDKSSGAPSALDAPKNPSGSAEITPPIASSGLPDTLPIPNTSSKNAKKMEFFNDAEAARLKSLEDLKIKLIRVVGKEGMAELLSSPTAEWQDYKVRDIIKNSDKAEKEELVHKKWLGLWSYLAENNHGDTAYDAYKSLHEDFQKAKAEGATAEEFLEKYIFPEVTSLLPPESPKKVTQTIEYTDPALETEIAHKGLQRLLDDPNITDPKEKIAIQRLYNAKKGALVYSYSDGPAIDTLSNIGISNDNTINANDVNGKVSNIAIDTEKKGILITTDKGKYLFK